MPEKPNNDNEKTDASGFPEDLPISSQYAKFARRAVPEEMRAELLLADGATYGEALAKALFDAAIKEKSVRAAYEIREAIEGRANQRRNPVERNYEVVVTYEQSPISRMLPEGTINQLDK